LHRDHIVPRRKGGGDEPANIQYLCANCHEDKTREDNKGLVSPMKGRHHSEESRQKMRESSARRTMRFAVYSRKGEINGRAKLTPELVAEIRAKYADGGTSYRRLADEYGIHFSNVGYIVRGQHWDE
jgi:hypothetical protein